MIKFSVLVTSAVSKPRTTVTTTTDFPRFRDDAAVGACETIGAHRGCWFVYVVLYVVIGQHTKMGTQKESLLGL